MDESLLLYSKYVDKSTLYQGFTIPREFHPLFFAVDPALQEHGKVQKIKLLIDDEIYDAKLQNVDFDPNIHTHSDVLQIRYSEKSPIALKLQQLFFATKQYIDPLQQAKKQGDRRPIDIPEEIREYIYICATSNPLVYSLDYVTLNEAKDIKKDLQTISEEEFEAYTFIPKTDIKAGITTAVRKVRKYDKGIGESLKRLYDFRCQVTGEKIGNEYSVHVVEAHHIVPFTQSLNNDSCNIVIVSPTFHRIIHQAKPIFNHKNLTFEFPNGLNEPIKLNRHLEGPKREI